MSLMCVERIHDTTKTAPLCEVAKRQSLTHAPGMSREAAAAG